MSIPKDGRKRLGKFKLTSAQKKVRVVWDRKPFTKVKDSKKKYKRDKRLKEFE